MANSDPQSSYANALAGYIFLLAGQLEEAIKFCRRAMETEPQNLLATSGIGQALACALEWEEAHECLGRAADLSSRAPFYLGLLAWVQAASGRQVEACRTLDELAGRAATE
jgi:Flp pilus assembly protein TadD